MVVAKAGRDKFGHFVMFGGFRSAMPDGETARRAAASTELLGACEAFLEMPYPAIGQRMSEGAHSDIQRYRELTRTAVAKARGQ